MRKTFRLEELDCANCAAKMERAITKIEGVAFAQVNFLRQSLTVEAPDDHFNAVLQQVQKVIRKIEPDVHLAKSFT